MIAPAVSKKRKPATFDPATVAKYSESTKAPFLCKKCGKPFDKPPALAMHFRRSHGAMQGDPKLLKTRNNEQPDLGASSFPMTRREARANLAAIGVEGESRKRIDLSTDERAQVVDAAVTAWMDDPSRGFSFHVFNAVIPLVLPEGRRRKLVSDHACRDLRDRAVTMAKEIIARASRPLPEPEIQTRTVEIEKPVDIPALLATLPLDALAGALAAGEMRLKLRQYELAGVASPGLPSRPKRPAEPPPKLPSERRAEIEALFPQVQVVGFRGPQHADFVHHLRNFPIKVHKSIDPSAPIDCNLIAPSPAIIFVDAENASDRWKAAVVPHLSKEPHRRQSVFGPSRITHKAAEIAKAWAEKHPELLAEWKGLPS